MPLDMPPGMHPPAGGGMPGAGMGGPPPGGGLAGGTGGATMPTPMKGEQQQGAAGLKAAVELLQKSLGSLPLGSEIHNKVLRAVTDLSKAMGEVQTDVAPQDQIQQLVAQARAAQQGGHSPLAAMMPPGPGGGQPPSPPMGAPA